MSKEHGKRADALTPQERAARELLVDMNRRRFLRNSASAVTGATIALASGKKSWYAWAAQQSQRPCLISIHLPGGWDTNWFHSAFPKSMFSTAPDNPNYVAGVPKKLWKPNDSLGTPLPMPALPADIQSLIAQQAALNPADPNYAKDNADLQDKIDRYQTPGGLDPWGRVATADLTTLTLTDFNQGPYTERAIHNTSVQNLLPHSKVGGHFMGLAGQLAFGITNFGSGGGTIDNFFSKTCIWKGIYSGGAHSIPNINIIHGSTSQYAISFSGLIAESLAKNYGKLKLNYVQLTASPSEYGANWAMAKGDQIPINCPDQGALKKLTKRSDKDFAGDALYGKLNDSVTRLGNEIGKEKFALSRSKEIYDEYMKFFKGALDIATLGTNMDSFLKVWQEYANYALDKVATIYQPNFIKSISPEVAHGFMSKAYNFHLLSPYLPEVTPKSEGAPLKDYTKDPAPTANPVALYGDRNGTATSKHQPFINQLTVPFDATEKSLVTDAAAAGAVRKFVADTAWKFALAEFLVVNGYSSVVDIAISTGDHHGDNADEVRLLTTVYSCYAHLLDKLNKATYLDRTLVAMFSEFDRTAGISDLTTPDNRGTNHDITESILFAGFGIAQGTVVGNRRYPTESADGTKIDFIKDKKTGEKVHMQPNFTYVFPTIMKIFGVDIPAQQITDATYVDPVLGIKV